MPDHSGEQFVTSTELAEWMRTRPDDALDECLDAALEWASEQVGPLTRGAAITRTYQVWPSGRCLVLPDTHLQAVTAVTDPAGADVPLSEVVLDLQAGIVELPTRRWTSRGTWTVTATPRDAATSVALAVKVVASHLYDTQRGRPGDQRTRAALGQQSPVGTPRGFAIPKRADELIAPFRRGQW